MISRLIATLSDLLDDSRFALRIERGRVQVTKGTLPPDFVSDLGEFASGHPGVAGVIRGKRDGTRTRLTFSAGIPEDTHQRLRNIWSFHETQRRIDAR
jgi:hypothetical protein